MVVETADVVVVAVAVVVVATLVRGTAEGLGLVETTGAGCVLGDTTGTATGLEVAADCAAQEPACLCQSPFRMVTQ